jgi:hypothetical protein
MIKSATQLVKPALIAMAFVCFTTWMQASSPAAHVVEAYVAPGIVVALR